MPDGRLAKETALNSYSSECGLPRRSSAEAGHNNIKINPVFRGMVRCGEFSTKGKLC
jgi:hypothetical protein